MRDMTAQEKKYWLGFSAFPGIGPLRFRLLLTHFGSAKRAWNASRKDLLDIGLGERLTNKFLSFRDSFSLDTYQREIEQKKIHVVTLYDTEYPRLLSEISDAPFLLYVRGDLSILTDESRPRFGVVGTRQITNYGEEVTRKITRGLVDAHVTIVSGMAYGVDGVAHETAIASGGKTIAVLGCGVDIVHPKTNSTIYWKIVRGAGAVISEFPMGMWADKGMFPARNRIISGLSLGVVVTEGAEDSGALITARYAAEQGREVFAIPGSITSSLSKGPTLLLKQGAKLVTDAQDILGELKLSNNPINQSSNKSINEIMKNATKDERIILELLERESLHFDELVRKSKLGAHIVGSILTLMEMKGYVQQISGGIYQNRV